MALGVRFGMGSNMGFSIGSGMGLIWEKAILLQIKTQYEEIACAKKYSAIVEPLDPIKLTNFKKVEVTVAYTFFTENGKPLIWYYKNREGEIEYFTAPGLHPVNGKTLRKITEGIIKKYVPLHSNKTTSFLEWLLDFLKLLM